MRFFERMDANVENFEVMKVPEVSIQKEEGPLLLSLILRISGYSYNKAETGFANNVDEFFMEHPLNSDIVDVVQTFQELRIDEETLYNMSLAFNHPERLDSIVDFLKLHKNYTGDYNKVYAKLQEILEEFSEIFSESILVEEFYREIEVDINKRTERLDDAKERIKSIVDFYRPDSNTSNIREVVFLPTDPIYSKSSGYSFFGIPDKVIIMSNIDNTDNQDHEFSHSLINPMIEKLSQNLSESQKDKIINIASDRLKQDYGNNHYILLCEEFIRTYIDIFRKDEKPVTYESFAQAISGITQEQFEKYLLENVRLKERCEELNINTVQDLNNKAYDYFERFEENELQNLIFEFYKEYKNRTNKKENFEQFLLLNFSTKL